MLTSALGLSVLVGLALLGLGLGLDAMYASSETRPALASGAVGDDEPGEGDTGPCRPGPTLGLPDEAKGAGIGGPLEGVEGLGDAEVVSDGEGLGEGVEDGAVLCLSDGVGEGEGDGDAVAETGSASHCVFVEAVAPGLTWAAWAPPSTPRARTPPLTKLTAAIRACAKRMRIACLRCSSGLPRALRMFGGDKETDGYGYSYPLSEYLCVGIQGPRQARTGVDRGHGGGTTTPEVR
jgi:hypothetical protein